MPKKHALGIDLGGTNIKVGILNEQGELLEFSSYPTPTASAQAIVEAISGIIVARDKHVGFPLLVGLGVPAVVDRATREVVRAPNLISQGFSLREAIEKEVGRQIVVDNDANMAALGEWWQGAGSIFGKMILLTLGTGVGAGMVNEGVIDSGAHGWAGEIGHTVIYPDGERCSCGKKGCLERYASAAAVARRFAAITGEDASTEQIFSLARAGHPVAQQVINEAIDALALGVYNLSLLLDPQGVIFGGGMMNAGQQLMDPLVKKINGFYQTYPGTMQTLLLKAKLGNQAGVIGAAKAALDMKII